MNPALEIPGAPAEGETLKKIYFHLDKPKIIVSETMYGAYLELAGKTGIERSHMIHTGEGGGRETGGEFFLPKERHLSPEDTALLFLTSGTTGTPKCVMQTNKAAVSRENALKKVFDYENRTSLNWMPLEHPGGLFMAHLNGLSNYGEQIQVEKGYILQNITRWLDLIEEFQVNRSWAPHFAYVLLKKEAEKQTVPRDLSSVVNLLDGGEMVDARTGKEFVRLFKNSGSGNALFSRRGECVKPAREFFITMTLTMEAVEPRNTKGEPLRKSESPSRGSMCGSWMKTASL